MQMLWAAVLIQYETSNVITLTDSDIIINAIANSNKTMITNIDIIKLSTDTNNNHIAQE